MYFVNFLNEEFEENKFKDKEPLIGKSLGVFRVIEVSGNRGRSYSVQVNQMQGKWYLFFISYQGVLEIGIIPLHMDLLHKWLLDLNNNCYLNCYLNFYSNGFLFTYFFPLSP